jgi:hypothetical protein
MFYSALRNDLRKNVQHLLAGASISHTSSGEAYLDKIMTHKELKKLCMLLFEMRKLNTLTQNNLDTILNYSNSDELIVMLMVLVSKGLLVRAEDFALLINDKKSDLILDILERLDEKTCLTAETFDIVLKHSNITTLFIAVDSLFRNKLATPESCERVIRAEDPWAAYTESQNAHLAIQNMHKS